MNNLIVAHQWANRLRHAANGSNFYFEGDTIYSYGSHFPIAKHLDNNTVLFTRDTYSSSTSRHIHYTRSAASHKTCIYVPSLNNSKEQNFKYWIDQIEGLIIKLETARKKEKYINEIQYVYSEVKAYCEYFKYEIPQDFTRLADIANDEEYVQYLQDRRANLERERRENEKRQKKEFKAMLKAWKAFKHNNLSGFYGWSIEGFSYLRYNKDTKRIETSKGIQIPLDIARKFWDHIQDVLNTKASCYGDCDYKILDYEVQQINKDFLEVGCHKVSMKEIKAMVKLLGL